MDNAAVTGAGLAERLDELRRDDLHGASWVARRALEALAGVAEEEAATTDELLARLVAAARELATTRPAAAAVRGAVGRVVAAAHANAHLPPEHVSRIVAEEATGLVQRRDRAKASIAVQLRERLEDAFVLTHSASATVREALVRARPALVTCTVTEPHGEGRRFADELRGEGLAVELVADRDAPSALRSVSVLLLGADTVFRDGAICNRAGSARLAEAAAEHMIPTVVAAETIKFAPVAAADASALDSESAALFEVVEARLVEEIVTEDGAVAGEDVAPLVDRTPLLADGWSLLGT